MRAALTAGIVLGVFSLAPATRAQDLWGCEVLLCLSDPRGPTTESQCVPPVHRLFRHLARGGSFPSCVEAGNSRASNRTASADWCPSGYLRPHPDIPNQSICLAAGSIDVFVNGQPWQRIWWGIASEEGRGQVTTDYASHFTVPLAQR